MSYTMTAKEYEVLYARYLKRKPEELLEMAGLKKGDEVLDLCAGSGRASLAALKMGAAWVCAVDANNNGWSPALIKARTANKVFTFGHHTVDRFLTANISANSSLQFLNHFDVAICQQAITYWLTADTAYYLAKHLKENGRFVFNTFRNAPSPAPTVKIYTLDDRLYTEVFYLVGDTVHHTQTCQGMPPHVTAFKYISPKDFMKMLKPAFKSVKVIADGATDIYVCTK